ncbi:MAG: MFS transporter [Parcubacteria group bacterium]|jgi:MFS family permease
MTALNKTKHRDPYLPPVFLFGLVIFFWTIFDCMLTYITPILMEENGFSIGMIGLIIGTSSISGAFFDFLICKFFKNADFRHMFWLMFVVCASYPLLLSQANGVWFYLFVMAVWGLYYDLSGFGTFNFIGRYTKKSDHASHFGVVQIFRALGSVLAPLIVGFVIVSAIDWRVFAVSWIFLGIGLGLFIILLFLMYIHGRKDVHVTAHKEQKHKSLFREIDLWKKLGKIMTPVLCVTFFLSFVDAFFWTLAPLYVETIDLGKFGGLFLTAYILPALFVGWIVGNVTRRFGKKRTALLGILIGSTILTSFVHVSYAPFAIITIFVAACFISIALPAINAAYADYISEAPCVDSEIEGVEDLSFNSGYIFGPVFAGVLAGLLGIPGAFSVLGLIGVVLAAVLLVVTPKNILIRIK